MMKFQGALVKEQGVHFAIVIVKRHILSSPSEREKTRRGFARVFRGVPVVLMAQDEQGVPTYSGRRDIVQFLARTRLRAIPWKEFTLN
jgi:hypothetical protein